MKPRSALIVSSILCVTGCGGSGEDSTPPETITVVENQTLANPAAAITDSSAYMDIGVHDPSVVKADGTYYIFGSHLAAAKTTDLQTWEYISSLSANNMVDESPLFNTYSTEFAEGIAWTDDFTGSWASDVIQAPDGKFWFYYNHCAQDNPDTPERDEVCWHRSYLGLATSDSVEGPYVDKGVFLRSGYRDEAELAAYPVDGVETYNPAVHPNAIDPAAFYDKDGNLWMVYGSYSGGIFVLAMDEQTGMPEAGQGYGKHLVGGNYNAIEGAFVIYSPDSDYYYLFWSNAGFAAGDGYNIRVARSRTPDGPYLDAAGNDMTGATVANNYGNKLLGSHLWSSAFGETSSQYGYNAPGHNSALYDEELDKYLLFTHTRFPDEEDRYDNPEAHAVRVHEMWINNDGWLVVSPHRYAPVDGENVTDAEDVAGDYRLILQSNDSNGDEHESVYVTLNSQGRSIQGQLTGTYKLYSDDPSRIRLTIDDDTVYEGVAKWQWNVEDARFEVVISALSGAGESLLAAKLPERSVADVVDDISNAIDVAFANPANPDAMLEVKNDLSLQSTGARGAVISWESSHPQFISASGAVTRPNVDEGDQVVTLTANVDINGQTLSVTKDVKVIARSTYNRTAWYSFEDSLEDSLMNYDDAQSVTDVNSFTSASAVFSDGSQGRAVNLDGSYGILLPDNLIDSYQYTVSFWLNTAQTQFFSPAFFAANQTDRWISFLPVSWNAELMVWANYVDDEGAVSWFDGLSGVAFPLNEWHHVAFSVEQGFVSIFYDGTLVGTASSVRDIFTVRPEGAIITLGLNYWDVPLNAQYDELKIYDEALSAAEISALDVEQLPAEALVNIAQADLDLGNLDFVITDIALPHTGPFASALNWESSNSAVIDPATGKVTRPARGEADAEVTLTATISLAGQSVSKSFVANVISNTPPEAIARFSFEENLEDTQGNFAAGEEATKTADTPLIVPADTSLTYQAGVAGMAAEFKGDQGPGVKLPDGLISDYSYAVSMWLNPASLNQFTTTFFGYAASNSWISLVPFGPGSGDTMVWSGEQWFDGTLNAQIPTGSWTHIVFVVNEGTFYGYINGELVSTMENFPDVFTASGANSGFSLATNLFPWDANFSGLMDELVIYDDPLSADDVQALFAEGSN